MLIICGHQNMSTYDKKPILLFVFFFLSFYSRIIYVQQSSNWPHREKREKEKYIIKESTHRHHFTITFFGIYIYIYPHIQTHTHTHTCCRYVRKKNGYLKTCSMMEVRCRQSEHDWCDIEELDTRINYPSRQTR